jgi:hypothetical protein
MISNRHSGRTGFNENAPGQRQANRGQDSSTHERDYAHGRCAGQPRPRAAGGLAFNEKASAELRVYRGFSLRFFGTANVSASQELCIRKSPWQHAPSLPGADTKTEQA